VTGGARGIGFAIVKALAAEGATSVIADINEAGAQQAIASLGLAGALALRIDVADKASAADEDGLSIEIAISGSKLALSRHEGRSVDAGQWRRSIEIGR
jgi:NAD(P)-dependent dehydrogenase (short-subunit alcohol dehydrogenase family)